MSYSDDDFCFLDSCDSCGFALDTSHDYLCSRCQEQKNRRSNRREKANSREKIRLSRPVKTTYTSTT